MSASTVRSVLDHVYAVLVMRVQGELGDPVPLRSDGVVWNRRDCVSWPGAGVHLWREDRSEGGVAAGSRDVDTVCVGTLGGPGEDVLRSVTVRQDAAAGGFVAVFEVVDRGAVRPVATVRVSSLALLEEQVLAWVQDRVGEALRVAAAGVC